MNYFPSNPNDEREIVWLLLPEFKGLLGPPAAIIAQFCFLTNTSAAPRSAAAPRRSVALGPPVEVLLILLVVVVVDEVVHHGLLPRRPIGGNWRERETERGEALVCALVCVRVYSCECEFI